MKAGGGESVPPAGKSSTLPHKYQLYSCRFPVSQSLKELIPSSAGRVSLETVFHALTGRTAEC